MGYIALIIIVIILIPILLGTVGHQSYVTHHENKVAEWHSSGIEYKVSLRHMGGHPYLKQNAAVEITAKSDGTIVFTEKSSGAGYTIKANQITACDMSDETQINSRVTATRLVTLGVFALAAPKKTTTHTYYLTLSYSQNGVNVDCLFVGSTPFGEFVSAMNKLRLEKA